MSGTSQPPLREVVLNEVTPESVDPAEVNAALDDDRAPVRQRGARVAVMVAEADADAIRPFVDALGRALRDDNPGVVRTAAAALTEAGTADPAVVAGVLDDAVTLVDSKLGGVRLSGARLLATVAKQEPDRCTPIVGTLLDHLGRLPTRDESSVAACVDDRVTQRTVREHEEEEQEYHRIARQVFANVAVAVAEADPSAVADHVDTLADLTAVEEPVVCGAALEVLAAVGRDTPSAVAPVADSVVSCLDDDASVVRARAVKTLGFLEDERYADALREVAETDPNDEVATFADDTAAFLAQ
ncbi:hypothetical protein EGH21_19135 [Halomicroarcula sp. F13]|uniref:Uncharacterized protein n=1 Tax=Haloarcula rubra TaxID=2487747 RepID=A0AAW4PX50_9EURY|nr:HEAT repeat domain-containing protein [Halomicroarcula rubra]MBX0325145.1 hypothetical protein [Halomicroarcula rubra]